MCHCHCRGRTGKAPLGFRAAKHTRNRDGSAAFHGEVKKLDWSEVAHPPVAQVCIFRLEEQAATGHHADSRCSKHAHSPPPGGEPVRGGGEERGEEKRGGERGGAQKRERRMLVPLWCCLSFRQHTLYTALDFVTQVRQQLLATPLPIRAYLRNQACASMCRNVDSPCETEEQSDISMPQAVDDFVEVTQITLQERISKEQFDVDITLLRNLVEILEARADQTTGARTES